ncbi:MAG: hypothetical protein IPL61_11050 [Myxococcales bacterium]|nr:hypothetical protein [Myxococcales bacterium]
MRRALAALGALAACGHPAPTTTARGCPTAAVVASSQEQLDALAGCARLPGLSVRSAAPLDLAPLAGLAQVDGDLIIGPTLALTSVGLPGLRTVGGRFAVVSGGAISGVFAPTVVEVGALEIRDLPSLATLSLSRLVSIGGPITIARVLALELVDVSALTTTGAVAIDAPPATTWLGARPVGAAGP